MRITKETRNIIEQRTCPEHFQDRITQAGGLNKFGDPNFKIVWAQSETSWQGGHWNNEDGSFTGYRKVLKGDGLPHWMLMQYIEAGKSAQMPFLPAEGPYSWYLNTKCPDTGLQILGEFPYNGSYQIVMPLITKNVVGGELIIDTMSLSARIISIMIPIIKNSMKVTLAAKLRSMEEDREREKLDRTNMIQDMVRDIKINPNLHASWLDDRQRKLEAAARMNKALPNQGFFQSNRPL